MLRAFFVASFAAAAFAGAAAAAKPPTILMPDVTFHRNVQFTVHGAAVVNVVEAPRPTGLYSLQPVLGRETVQGRERLTPMEKRLSTTATVAGVNGDVFDRGVNGLVLRNGVMNASPLGSRSSLGVDAAGNLAMGRIPFVGDWRGTGQRRALSDFNHPPGAGGTALFTPAWGGRTPADGDAVEAVVSPFPVTTANADLRATVTQILTGGDHAVPPGSAILEGRGNAGTRIETEAPVGTLVTTRLLLPGAFSGALDGIGGGPMLVRNGKALFRPDEAFATRWFVRPSARTAVGQRADGRILLVAVDGGPRGYSAGMTNFELAQELVRLGAVTAMGLDSGPSTTMAFEGELLDRPFPGERAIGDALMLLYWGVQAPPPSNDVLSPNGDAAGERETLAYKLVRRSFVTAVVSGPGGAQVTLDSGDRQPGLYTFTWDGADAQGMLLPEGRWTWDVRAVDDLGRSSSADRPFSLNTTLKNLTVERGGGAVRIGIDLTRTAELTIQIETRSGTVVRTLASRSADAGHASVVWNGRVKGNRRAHPGSYVVRALATNAVGAAELTQSFRLGR